MIIDWTYDETEQMPNYCNGMIYSILSGYVISFYEIIDEDSLITILIDENSTITKLIDEESPLNG